MPDDELPAHGQCLRDIVKTEGTVHVVGEVSVRPLVAKKVAVTKSDSPLMDSADLLVGDNLLAVRSPEGANLAGARGLA